MNLDGFSLDQLGAALRESPGLLGKREIQRIARATEGLSGEIRNGDDAAAIPDGDGYTLLAAEGMLPAFLSADPWFAGFCAVLTNVNDIAAMGGRPLALVDVLFTGGQQHELGAVLDGLAAGANTYGVPIVGGHVSRSDGPPHLAAAIVGKARRLISSFAARPGDVVLACIDLRGEYRGQSLNFDAVTAAKPSDARAQLAILPELAELGLVHAGKDISMAGLPGTLLMLLESSGCGAVLDLAAVPAPESARTDPLRWLRAFPSCGFLLVAAPNHVREVSTRFADLGMAAAAVAELRDGHSLDLSYAASSYRYWDLERAALVGFEAAAQGAETCLSCTSKSAGRTAVTSATTHPPRSSART
jgi:AIR synthase-related protein